MRLQHVVDNYGLSPRVRGNHRRRRRRLPVRRSIPACAGEPNAWPHGGRPLGVYPRVCGGTGHDARVEGDGDGLSPRVRGNQGPTASSIAPSGSIPACAGEPLCVPQRQADERVYPRVCGGTSLTRVPSGRRRGLSPRVRGNPLTPRDCLRIVRSIPACAGEPPAAGASAPPEWVYPRVCGGTPRLDGGVKTPHGLSPRVRGNPSWYSTSVTSQRSIPACAGEPRGSLSEARRSGVYPRVCGGTVGAGKRAEQRHGLSPRVRGNPPRCRPWPPWTRSIPACAGEPIGERRRRSKPAVYPRVCGGTPW